MRLGTDEKGHRTLDGARWHFPHPDDPTKCGDKSGCDYVMQGRR